MVVFTCGHCGDSIQKPKVEKHYSTKCRNRSPNLSCMDCFKDFLGNDYESHTNCITEEERYGGKGFVAKEKKGLRKQNAWIDMVQNVVKEHVNAPKNVVNILKMICNHINTPRKKQKFINFVKSTSGHKFKDNDIEAAWDLISVKLVCLNTPNNDRSNNANRQANNVENKDKNEENNVENNYKKEENNVVDRNGKADSDEKTNEVNNVDNDNALVANGNKTKKQRKEEKKRKKYEAELQKASEVPDEIAEKLKPSKKDKKEKEKSDNLIKESELKSSKRQHSESISNDNGLSEGKKKKKPKTDKNIVNEDVNLHEQNVASIQESTKLTKFNWNETILTVLQKKGNEIAFKRLQKKVLGEYCEATGNIADDRIAEKLTKKLKSIPNVKIDKNKVLLVD